MPALAGIFLLSDPTRRNALLDAHVVPDGGYPLEAVRDPDRLVHGRIGTHEAAELHGAFEGLNVDLACIDVRIIDQGHLHFRRDPAVGDLLPGTLPCRTVRASRNRHERESEKNNG